MYMLYRCISTLIYERAIYSTDSKQFCLFTTTSVFLYLQFGYYTRNIGVD